MKCNCGRDRDNLVVYFHIESGLRVTACNGCETEKKLKGNKDFYRKELNKLTKQDNSTPEPNATHKQIF